VFATLAGGVCATFVAVGLATAVVDGAGASFAVVCTEAAFVVPVAVFGVDVEAGETVATGVGAGAAALVEGAGCVDARSGAAEFFAGGIGSGRVSGTEIAGTSTPTASW
jgi:hypothetical protein